MAKLPEKRKNILREWVENLPLRLQGTLLTGVRGADNVQRDDPIKFLVRMYRDVILYTVSEVPSSFVFPVAYDSLDQTSFRNLETTMDNILASHDHYPHHYLMHMIHCAEIVGYEHPDQKVKKIWLNFYMRFCGKFHMFAETRSEMLTRLTKAEKDFAEDQ